MQTGGRHVVIAHPEASKLQQLPRTPCHRTRGALHRGEHVARAHQPLRDLIRDLLIEGAATGDLRKDVAPDELASYCLHALTAASNLRSKAAVHRLVTVTLAGLRPGRASFE
jgi:hypothetical protein